MRSLAAFSTLALAMASTMSLAQTSAPAPLPANVVADRPPFKTDTRALRNDVKAYLQNERGQPASVYSQLRTDQAVGNAAVATTDTTKPQTDRSALQSAQMPTRTDSQQGSGGAGSGGRPGRGHRH